MIVCETEYDISCATVLIFFICINNIVCLKFIFDNYNLGCGLFSVMVRSYIVEKTLPAWLDAYNSNYIEFMQSINVESFTDITMLALKALFK